MADPHTNAPHSPQSQQQSSSNDQSLPPLSAALSNHHQQSSSLAFIPTTITTLPDPALRNSVPLLQSADPPNLFGDTDMGDFADTSTQYSTSLYGDPPEPVGFPQMWESNESFVSAQSQSGPVYELSPRVCMV